MKPRVYALCLLSLCTLPASSLLAQHAPPNAASATAAAASSEAKQFDFLLGEWTLEVRPKVSGLAAMIHGAPKLAGTWKAWRVLDGLAIEDELRIVDASGNPATLNRALRVWSPNEARWKVAMLDAYHARSSESSGRLQDGELRVEGRSTTADGAAVLTRTRYFAIGTDAFRMQQDRSTDEGKTWDEAVLSIDAKRSAASTAPQ